MKTGTKSLLFGVHQFIWHPITVLMAWINLFGMPNFKELICIIIHDWGYWGKSNMDDEEGEKHPELGALIALNMLDKSSYFLCLFHSRHYARKLGAEPSKLCWADKLSILYEPWWLYLPRAWASGELNEYRKTAAEYIPLSASHRAWYVWVQSKLATLAKEKRGDAVPYANPARQSKGGGLSG